MIIAALRVGLNVVLRDDPLILETFYLLVLKPKEVTEDLCTVLPDPRWIRCMSMGADQG